MMTEPPRERLNRLAGTWSPRILTGPPPVIEVKGESTRKREEGMERLGLPVLLRAPTSYPRLRRSSLGAGTHMFLIAPGARGLASFDGAERQVKA
jgi:hypothetical protein